MYTVGEKMKTLKAIFSKKRNIVAAVCLIVFVVIAILEKFYSDTLFAFDSVIYNGVKALFYPWATSVFKVLTHFASGLFLILLCFLFFLFRKRKLAFYSLLNLLIIFVINQVLKSFFSRTRPSDLMIIEEDGYSFPSGHAQASMAFYGLIICFIYHSNLQKKWRNLLISFLFFLIFLVGITRIYLGVHYVSDVLAGYLVSYVCLTIYLNIFENNLKEVL